MAPWTGRPWQRGLGSSINVASFFSSLSASFFFFIAALLLLLGVLRIAAGSKEEGLGMWRLKGEENVWVRVSD